MKHNKFIGRSFCMTLLFAVSFHLGAQQITQRFNNVPLKNVLEEVERNLEYSIIYKKNEVNEQKRITQNFVDATLDQVLTAVLDRDLSYIVEDKMIVISKKLASDVSQTKQVRGVVKDEQGEVITGATIRVKNGINGTISDMDGNFTLEVPENGTLLISYIGFQTQEVSVRGRNEFSIILQEDSRSIDEVVVIGYGSRVKKDLTGAVSQITSDEITQQVNLSPEFAMQGKMAGVYISNPGSSPTARPEIRIRGVSTLGYNDPLYVIDGIPLTEGGASSTDARMQDARGNVNIFNMINPNDIESISVLKDASATAIYGVRASNGVILITTKRGSEGKTRVDLAMSYGIQNLFKRYKAATMQEYVDWSLEAIDANPAYIKDQFYPLFDKNSSEYMGNSKDYRDDWMDAAIIKNAPIQDYNLTVSGGNGATNYAMGAGYASQEEVIYKDKFDRFSFFLNSDHKIGKWLKLGESYRFAYSRFKNRNTPDFNSISFITPWQPLYDATRADGLAVPGRTINNSFQSYGYGSATQGNFLGGDKYSRDERELIRNLGTFYAELTPWRGLRIRGTFSFDYYTNKYERYQDIQLGFFDSTRGWELDTGNNYTLRETENINIVKELLVGYTEKFGEHSFDLILNGMSQDIKWNLKQTAIDTNSPVLSWDQRYINEGWNATDKTSLYERYSSGLIGYMGRLSYNYAGKYYFDVTVRRDGTSKFAPGYKWGTFPSLAGAWRITSESFMENTNWLNDMKLRVGWGKTGNQETRDYAYLSMFNINPKAAFGNNGYGNGNIYYAGALGDFPIPDMTWETVSTTSVGVDMVMLENKINFTAEYYSRITDGILQEIAIPMVVGALNTPVVNLAKVSNKGMEFQAGYNDRFGDVGFNASFNLTTVKNRVSNLYRGQPYTDGNRRIEDGYSLNYIYGYKTDGIFQTQAEVDEWLSGHDDVGRNSQKSPGDVKFVDQYGAPDGSSNGALKSYLPDGKIDEYDQTYLGKTIPGYYFGFTVGADYRNWDIILGFRGVGDVQKINTLGLQSISGGGLNFLTDYRKRWTPEHPSNKIPRAVQSDPSGNNRISDRHVQNAGFLRFQNFQIGYNVRSGFLTHVGISKLRCYLSGSNLFVISPYNDLDPENITTPTTCTIGANISF